MSSATSRVCPLIGIGVTVALLFGCARTASEHPSHAVTGGTVAAVDLPQDPAAAAELRERFGSYTVERAHQEGYVRDAFCLDATAFGLPASGGAMGFHSTNEALLQGPIAPEKPQAIIFDVAGNVLGVEYEITTDVAREAPKLFGQTFSKLPPHPGVHHEHYALHVWLVPNPSGQFADFNPLLACPLGSTPRGSAAPPPAAAPTAQPQVTLPGSGVEVQMEDHDH